MKLKCIGGEHDGFVWDVENLMRTGDYVRVPETYKSVEHGFNPNSYEIKSIVRDELIYRIEEIRFAVDGQIDGFKFLVTQYPVHMTFEQALKYQFTK